ncbi:glycosyltransferase family 2 protein [Nocardioides sediminis]|uniref:glycosyltransferase family 2 protein n=1 Tax=Nocardioides sediminis TaxID=433648 RepID=UPI00190271A4|nr:glycosyltransferase family 2 protein [Nocardioides sediminis]
MSASASTSELTDGSPEEAAPIELSIVMPCLNEAETLATCIRHARTFLETSGVVGEVIIADNGSTDGSQQIAEEEGARVVHVAEKGYGAALIGGIAAARGTYVAMGDADDSYDFEGLGPYVDELRKGADLVMGNRFRGGIEPGAMPPLHRYLGNPVLSMVGRVFFNAPVKDFHCGLRAFRRDSITALGLRTTGMEFASEMVVKASLTGLDIVEVPTTLRKDGRSRPPHLRSWRDGWRHLRFLMLYSPRWVFFYPGLVLAVLGLVATAVLLAGPVFIGDFGLDVGTMIYSAAVAVVGYQAVLFFLLSKVYALHEGFLPASARFRALEGRLNLENIIVAGVVVFVLGLVWLVVSFVWWGDSDFGPLDPTDSVRRVLPAALSLIIGAQTIMAGVFLSLLRIRVVHPEPEVTTSES